MAYQLKWLSANVASSAGWLAAIHQYVANGVAAAWRNGLAAT